MKRSVLVQLTIATVLAACSSSPTSNNNSSGGSNSLTTSAATPASGDGAWSNIVVTVDLNGAVQQGPAVYLMVDGDVGGVPQHLEIYVLKSDNSLPNIEHTWGADLNNPDGYTLCDASGVFPACSATQVSGSITQQKVTFTGLALTAATADGDLSTLTGTVVW